MGGGEPGRRVIWRGTSQDAQPLIESCDSTHGLPDMWFHLSGLCVNHACRLLPSAPSFGNSLTARWQRQTRSSTLQS